MLLYRETNTTQSNYSPAENFLKSKGYIFISLELGGQPPWHREDSLYVLEGEVVLILLKVYSKWYFKPPKNMPKEIKQQCKKFGSPLLCKLGVTQIHTQRRL